MTVVPDSRAHFSAASPFQQIRAEYARFLEAYEIGTSKEARKVLEDPLCRLWIAVYKQNCTYPTALDLLDDRVASFLHDCAAYEGIGPVDRVVAALSVSQERLPLGNLLARLLAEREAGQTTSETLSLIRLTFISLSEGLSTKNLEKLTQAAARVLEWDQEPIPTLVDRWIDLYQSAASPTRKARLLGRALEVLDFGATKKTAGPDKRVSFRNLDSLRSLAAGAERDLAPLDRAILARELTKLIQNAPREVERKIAEEPSADLVDRIKDHILTLDFVNRPRPRYSRGARYLRRGMAWKTDLGHFIPHSAGGPADINLFQQDRRLNRGWSPQGRAYRSMERYIAEHPGLFHFSRAVYADETTIPRYLEIGVLLPKAQAEELASALAGYGGFYLCVPRSYRGGVELIWGIGIFDNQPTSE